MATVTPNFNWPVPTSTDLVKDGATAIEALGDSIDASLVDLKGGTTGQVLAKTTNADMDFTWVTNADGDITGVTVSSPLTGGGTSGTVTVGILSGTTSNLGAVQLSDSTSSTSTTLAATANAVKTTYDLASSAYTPAFTNNYYAGKNKIINGDFGIWQRGTTFSSSSSNVYTADRFFMGKDGTGTYTVSQQTFTPGTAPVSGYNGQYFYRVACNTVGTTTTFQTQQKIEDVRTYAGQTITISFWAKKDNDKTLGVFTEQNFGSGGSSSVFQTSARITPSTSWARYSVTYTLGSMTGKTIGANSFLTIYIAMDDTLTTSSVLDIWGLQVEAGSTATPFTTASGGSTQGELAMCQRYYWRQTSGVAYGALSPFGNARTTTAAGIAIKNAVTMRTTPSSLEFANLGLYDGTTVVAITAVTLTYQTADYNYVEPTVASGLTANRPYCIFSNNNSAGYIGFSAEL